MAILRFYAPNGLALADSALGKFDEANNTFDVPVTEAEGKILWQADQTIAPPVTVVAELLQDEEAIAKAEVLLDQVTEFTIEPTGGEADGMGGRVQVTFPAGAVSETVKVKVTRPSVESLPVQSLSGAPFELTATSGATLAEVSRFSAPVEIVVSYSEAGMIDDSSTMLYWYDPSDKQWKLPLSQRLDADNNLIYATTDHFTVFDTYTSNWESAETPTMSYFQAPGFTGAASFSMPIKAPPGPGGLQPSLSLSYSSSTVDNITSESQASWAGMGWSIAESYIEHNNNGTQGTPSQGVPKTADDTYQLSLNGTSIRMFRDGNGIYHSEDEQFYKVERDPNDNFWTVWDKSGTKYTFGLMTPQFRANYDDQGNCHLDQSPWRWSLSEVRNIYGQTMTYSYVTETKAFGGCGINLNQPTYTYPQAITYAGGRYRVYFDRLEQSETGKNPRKDLKSIWTAPTSYQSFQQSLLEAIRIEQDANGDGTFETLIRKYQFTYCNSSSCSIFPDLVWEQGGRTPTLVSMQEFGLNGTDSLPAYTFAYADKMHLTSASNGYGGTITYIYNNQTNYTNAPQDAWHAVEGGSPRKYKFDGQDTENWTNMFLIGGGLAQIGTATSQNAALESFQPGRWYKLVVRAKATAQSGTHTLEFGYTYKLNGAWVADIFDAPVTLTQSWATYESQPFFLPVNATDFMPKVRSVKSNQLDWIYLMPLPTYSRVTSRTLSSGADNYTFNYTYDNPHTNDPVVSVAAQGNHPYDKPYTSFRGHQFVTEQDPYGNQTITEYYQDDVTTGRTKSVTIKDYASGLKTLQVTTTTYGYSQWAAPTLTDVSDKTDPTTWLQPYDPLYCRFVYLTNETKDVYGLSPNQSVGTLTTTYAYDAYGNQITKTRTGGGVTLVTHTDFFPNTSAWLVGLPARTWVTDGTNTQTESLNLYDGANVYNVSPTVGIPTATRTWISGSSYNQTSMIHDAWGNVTAQTSWSGYGTQASAPTQGARTSYTTYDPTYHAYVVATTNPLNQTTTVAYNYSLGLPVSETDPNGAVTSVTYDSFGRFTGLTKPGDSTPTLTVSYQNSPFVVTLNQVVDATHTFTATRSYDGLGRQTLTNTNGILVSSTFNAYGKPLTQTAPHTSGEATYNTVTTYDALGRPKTVTAPDGSVTSTVYDGLTTTLTDANNHTTTTTTDILGRTLSVTPPTGPAVTFTYDPLGNMLTASRGGSTATLTYDNGGRKLTMADPDMGNWSYSYDALGAMNSQTDARGCMTNQSYDLLGRPTSKTYSNCPSTPSVTYTYDSGTNGIGRRSSMSVSGGDYTSWSYDLRGRVLSENKQIPGGGQFVTSFTYNSADLPVTMNYPDNEVVTFSYNNNMQPVNVDGTNTYAQNITYDSAGRMIQLVRGANKVNSVFTYNPWNVDGGRLQNLTSTQVSTGTPLQNNSYDYDPAGNILTITDSLSGPQTQTFQYDALDRLVNSSVAGGTNGLYTEGYSYDSSTGNLAGKNGATYTYDATHKHAVASLSNGNSYSYDANGNMTTRVANGQTYNLAYDAENRLVSVSGASTANFYYDGDSKQVKSIVDGATTYYVSDHYEVKNGVASKYYFAGATRLAVRTDGTLSFLLADHIGSSSVTTDANGVKTASALYKAFGETRYSLGNLGMDYHFTGQREEVSLGIYYFNARWYDGALGRFLSPDSIVPTSTQGTQAWDRYAFVNNNPVRYNDPTGHQANTRDEVGGSSGTSNSSNCNTETNTDADGNTCHDYQVTSPVCLNLPWIDCTAEEVANYMSRFQYPGQWPGSPVVDGDERNVAPAEVWGFPTPLCYIGMCDSGAITVDVAENNPLSIDNITQPSHIFDNGDVLRTSSQDANGSWSVTTHGSGSNNGYGILPGHLIDQVNQRIGPVVFKAVDLQLVAYTTVAETWQFVTSFFH